MTHPTTLPRHMAGMRALLSAALIVCLATLGIVTPTGTATAASRQPSAPTDVIGAAGVLAVTLTWRAPASSGKSPITTYAVRYSTNNGTSWARATSTQSTSTNYTVTRLSTDSTYVFQVRAKNKSGNGPWSLPSAAVTPGVEPTPPPPPPPPTVASQSIAVPSYIYPGDAHWAQLLDGAPTVGLAMINPNSGPGSAVDPNYVHQVAATKGRGILVVGYVHTSYTTRPIADVKADVDRHYDWYGVDGIFFDEVTDGCTNPAQSAYYQELHDYVKAKYTADEVVLNPGTRSGECYMQASDIIITFEDTFANYVNWEPSGWETAYPARRFWHLIINTTEADLANAISLSKARNVGWVYVTPDVLPNPWDTLPGAPYWNTELSLVS